MKASKAALIDLAQLEMGDSSDDSDFNVDEAKLNEDDDISINSDPDAEDGGSSSSGEGEEDDEDSDVGSTGPVRRDDHILSVTELLERARQKQQLVSQKVNNYVMDKLYIRLFNEILQWVAKHGQICYSFCTTSTSYLCDIQIVLNGTFDRLFGKY